MSGLIIISGIVIASLLIYGWVKAVNFLFKGLENKLTSNRGSSEPVNPYIQAQKAKDLNDKYYEEYLQYMAKNGSGVPLDKIKTREELKAEVNLRKVI